MTFSGMSSKEKTIVAILGVIILAALIGIGILVARLVTGDQGGRPATGIAVSKTPATAAPEPAVTVTLVAPPSLDQLAQTTPGPISDKPVIVGRAESPGPFLPAMLTNHPLHAGRRYRLEITAADGSSIRIWGSWSQAAMGAKGEIQMPLPQPIDGVTPFRVDIAPPLANPTLWSCSVSVSSKDLQGQPPGLVITIWDVTGGK